MKKFFIFLAVSLFTVSAFAQTEQGKIRIGGDSGFNFLNSKINGDDDSMNNFDIGLGGSYFFIDNFAADVELMFDYSKYGDFDAESTFGIGIGVRYYLPPKIFVGASFDVLNMKVGDESASGTGVTLKAGYAAFLSDKIAIEPSVGYRIGLSDKDKGTQINNLFISVGFSFYF